MRRAITNNFREPVRYFIDDKEVSEEEFERSFISHPPGEVCSLSSTKAVASVQLAVHPDQVPEAVEDAKKRGVPTEFKRNGKPIIRSREHNKRYCQAYGFFNRDAGYGDAQPGQSKLERPDQEDKYFEASDAN